MAELVGNPVSGHGRDGKRSAKPKQVAKAPWLHEQVRVPIYGANLHVILTKKCAQIHEARVALKDVLGPVDPNDEHNHWSALCTCNGSNFGILFAQEQLSHGIIAHEVFHVAHRIMEFIEGAFGPNNHEPTAYLVEWLTTFVYRHVKPRQEAPV